MATSDFDPGPGTHNEASNGGSDIFLLKLDPSQNFEWVYTWGDTNYDWAEEVIEDPTGNAYVCGEFMGTVDFDPTSGTEYHVSDSFSSDAFVAKYPADMSW
jgi:hypothetical protein